MVETGLPGRSPYNITSVLINPDRSVTETREVPCNNVDAVVVSNEVVVKMKYGRLGTFANSETIMDVADGTGDGRDASKDGPRVVSVAVEVVATVFFSL